MTTVLTRKQFKSLGKKGVNRLLRVGVSLLVLQKQSQKMVVVR